MLSLLYQAEVRRLLVLLQPVEILNISPEVGLSQPVLLGFVLLSAGVLPVVGPEHHASAVLDDGLAGHEDPESGLVGFVDTQLMTVEFEAAIDAILDEDSRSRNCCFYLASPQALQEQDFGLIQDLDIAVLAVHDFEGPS